MATQFMNYSERERHKVDVSGISLDGNERSRFLKHLEHLLVNDRSLSGETKLALVLQLVNNSSPTPVSVDSVVK
ncbi:MAG: hypothetical protein H8E12_01745 [Rhodobacteraceae bacterium]|nr:hypothetical protein [Paracoccaceae bacterium]